MSTFAPSDGDGDGKLTADVARVRLMEDVRSGTAVVKISNLVVQQYRTYTGRGPTKARATIDSNLIMVELRETLTTGERNLIAAGHYDTVLEMRKAYQEIMHDALVSGIEKLTQRKVVALLSDNHLEPDIAVEVFVLEPLD